MRSSLVVISWWSNCLGLACLERLAYFAPDRELFVVQVGKSSRQRTRFRAQLSPNVRELAYPATAPAEHGPVVEAVTLELLADREGLWFVDHDLFLDEPAEPWLARMDESFEASGACLGYPVGGYGPSMTSPAFWLSPRRCPRDLPGFAAVPYEPSRVARQPGRFRASGSLRLPQSDTLVAAFQVLQARGLTAPFPLTWAAADELGGEPLPEHEHLSGLSVLTLDAIPPSLRPWAAERAEAIGQVLDACPPEWRAIEDPALLRRLARLERELVVEHAS